MMEYKIKQKGDTDSEKATENLLMIKYSWYFYF